MINCHGDINDYLKYDHETGIVTWIKTPSDKVKFGSEAGTIKPNGYKMVGFNNKKYYFHRLAWFLYYGKWPEGLIDHINGNKLDNRICNLREATITQNAYNSKTPKNNTSGVKGIYWHKKSKKWMARINTDGVTIYLGVFKNIEDAEEAIKQKRLELHKEFSNHG